MTTIGSYEAKTHLPRLLDEVEAGASFVITKHGRPVARLVGIRGDFGSSEALVAAFQEARKGKRLGVNIRELIEEGRKW